jgi:hypothetical protein
MARWSPRTVNWATASFTAMRKFRYSLPGTKRITNGFSETENARRYVKDGINDYVVSGNREAVNPAQAGTTASAL